MVVDKAVVGSFANSESQERFGVGFILIGMISGSVVPIVNSDRIRIKLVVE